MGVTHAGACPNRTDGDDIREFRRRTKDSYRKLVLRNGKLVGAIFVGETQKAGIMSMLLKKQINVTEAVPVLMSPHLSFMDLLPLLRRNGDQFTEPEYKELMDTGL
jgi:NAD(P)H-nitrite reductase large subunit